MSLYIVLNTEDPGFDAYVDGKALARHCDMLDTIAANAEVKPLMSFFSTTLADVAGLADMSPGDALEWAEEVRSRGGNPPSLEAEWFGPAEGLQTVRRLRKWIETNPDAVPETERVLFNLDEFERVLTEAETCGFQWHLSVDY